MVGNDRATVGRVETTVGENSTGDVVLVTAFFEVDSENGLSNYALVDGVDLNKVSSKK